MQVFKLTAILMLLAAVGFSSCERTVERDVIIDNVLFGIDTIPVYSSAAEKNRVKTPTQFVSTLYANLYLRPISSSTLSDLSLLQLSNGDKGMVNELFIQSFLADPVVQDGIPSYDEMRNEPEQFIRDSYLRFFLRLPTAYESYGLVQKIENDAELTPESMYRAFLLSNEYYFY